MTATAAAGAGAATTATGRAATGRARTRTGPGRRPRPFCAAAAAGDRPRPPAWPRPVWAGRSSATVCKTWTYGAADCPSSRSRWPPSAVAVVPSSSGGRSGKKKRSGDILSVLRGDTRARPSRVFFPIVTSRHRSQYSKTRGPDDVRKSLCGKNSRAHPA